MRWVHQYSPILEERIRKHIKKTNDSWRVEERYLYEATGNVVGSLNPKDEMVSYAYTAYGDLKPDSPQPTILMTCFIF